MYLCRQKTELSLVANTSLIKASFCTSFYIVSSGLRLGEVSLEPLRIEGSSQPEAGEQEAEAVGKPREEEFARDLQAKLEHAGFHFRCRL